MLLDDRCIYPWTKTAQCFDVEQASCPSGYFLHTLTPLSHARPPLPFHPTLPFSALVEPTLTLTEYTLHLITEVRELAELEQSKRSKGDSGGEGRMF